PPAEVVLRNCRRVCPIHSSPLKAMGGNSARFWTRRDGVYRGGFADVQSRQAPYLSRHARRHVMTLDRITVSVIQHRLESIVQEMGEAMLRTAYSQILNSSRDFSTAVFDGEGRLAAQAEHVPIHVGALPLAVKSVAEYFAGRIRPGDMYLLNDPYHGGNHLPDLTVLLPVFVGERLAFWSINRAHQSDIGGATHGAYNPGATEIWQEGIRIPPLKLYDAGVLRDDVMDMIATNVRHPRDLLGDLRAMIGSARVGERRLLSLVESYGAKTVIDSVDEILDGAERQARACVRTRKDGVYRGAAGRGG